MTARFVTLEGAREVRADHGAVVRAHGPLSGRPDVLVVPGGGWFDRGEDGAWAQARRGDIPRAIADRHAAGSVVASVCTGALLLAHAGVLRGRRATTNRGAYDDLRGFEGVEVVEARVVDDGDVVTAGGPVCGIDLALALVERFGGAALAGAAADRDPLRAAGQLHASSRSASARRKPAAVMPSSARWSQDMHR